MIFVTLGTQDKHFERLLYAIQKQIDNGVIKEEVIVQAGCSKITSKEMKFFDFMEEETFEKYMKNCDLLITHGGVGSILTGLKRKKKIIAVGRKKEFDEAANDHQEQIIQEFEKDGYILACCDLNTLDKVLKKAKRFHPKKYVSHTRKFVNQLDHYISTGEI